MKKLNRRYLHLVGHSIHPSNDSGLAYLLLLRSVIAA
jgi:hypothetical protein